MLYLECYCIDLTRSLTGCEQSHLEVVVPYPWYYFCGTKFKARYDVTQHFVGVESRSDSSDSVWGGLWVSRAMKRLEELFAPTITEEGGVALPGHPILALGPI